MNLKRQLQYSAIRFTRSSKSTGLLLIGCTVVSLLLTNLPIGATYTGFWDSSNAALRQTGLPSTVLEWINDGLMSLFFLTAGMEIKREVLTGEFRSAKRAILPLFAAIGGVIMPAVLFSLCTKGSAFAQGWGIPTATDIAFSIGILRMLGRRYVPASLSLFLTALAIIDDLIAILIVTFFYGGAIEWLWLALSAGAAVLVYLAYKKYPATNAVHLFLGLGLWYAMLQSGVHATLAGVVFSLLIPLKSMGKVEHLLHIPVNFFIIPLFALANTCIPLRIPWKEIAGHSLFWGISLGLFLGKVIGISLFSYLLIRLKWETLPSRTNWYQFIGAGILAGIGFTMSIFIATLAYENTEWQNISKIAILTGSSLSMLTGYCWLRFQSRKA